MALRSPTPRVASDDDVDAAEETAFGAIARRLRIASPERVRRALARAVEGDPRFAGVGGAAAGAAPDRPPAGALRRMLESPWPEADLWIVAVDLDVGRRVVFGRSGAPAATVGEAVEASCAIPGYFAPVTIDGARYVDGAVHSTTNADLVAELDPPPTSSS